MNKGKLSIGEKWMTYKERENETTLWLNQQIYRQENGQVGKERKSAIWHKYYSLVWKVKIVKGVSKTKTYILCFIEISSSAKLYSLYVYLLNKHGRKSWII